MREFLRAKILEEKEHQANRAEFRRKYFTPGCRYDSHADTLKRMESESIVDISQSASGTKVITEQMFHYSGASKRIRLLYHLQPMHDAWLIQDVQAACFVCEGYGDSSCPCCKGKQWLGAEQV